MLELDNILPKLESIQNSLSYFGPEVFLVILFVFLIIADLFLKNRAYKLLPILTILGLVCLIAYTFDQLIEYNVPHNKFIFSRFLHINQFEIFFKLLFAIAGLLTVLLTVLSSLGNNKRIRGEFYSILIALILGLNLMVMSTNLVMVYLSIEFVSICSYILTTFNFNKKSAEAGLKYVLFGSFSSGLMLYGMSLFYGLTGDIQFFEPEFLNSLEMVDPLVIVLAGVLTITGFLFKIAASPFHIWAPDVYEGAPTPIVAFFSVAPKAAGIVVLINFTYPFYFNHLYETVLVDWQLILGVIAILSLSIGNLAALAQNNVKRLLAYSSIAHAGFLISGLIAFSHLGVRSVMFYAGIYLLMNFAAFALVEKMSEKSGSEDVRKFKGLGGKIPFIGVIFVLVMISLTGLPPTAGFNAKLFVFSALWEAYQESGSQLLLTVFIFGLVNTVIALFYYLKIPYYMFFKKPEAEVAADISIQWKVYMLVLTVPLIVFFFKPDWIMNYIEKIILNF